jgi:nitrogenase subunit NifH
VLEYDGKNEGPKGWKEIVAEVLGTEVSNDGREGIESVATGGSASGVNFGVCPGAASLKAMAFLYNLSTGRQSMPFLVSATYLADISYCFST